MRVALLLLCLVPPLFAQTAKPTFIEPSLSPDAREIVFASGGDLWTVPATGGDARLIVSHPATGEAYTGRDSQLNAAVAALLGRLK